MLFAASAWPQTPMLWEGPSVDLRHGGIRVSANGRYFVHEDGKPFFYLADTAEELIHALNREQVNLYLENRRQKGFTVVLAAVLSEIQGVRTPNANGDRPLIDDNPARPDEAFFAHLDYIVGKAAEKGIVMALMPAWGDKLVGERAENWFANGPFIINAENGRVYARWLAERYKDRPNIIWVLGGDKFSERIRAHLARHGGRSPRRGRRAAASSGSIPAAAIRHPSGSTRKSGWLSTC